MPFGLWLAVAHPIASFVLLAVLIIAAILLARFLWKGVAVLGQRLRPG